MAADVAGEGDKTRVFISYSRKDSAFAEQILLALETSGYDAYLDRHDIAPGEPWQDRLDALILEADAVVFVISPNSAASEVCAWEVDQTVRYGKRLVPLVHLRVDGDMPDNLARLNWIFADTSVGLGDEQVAALRTAIDTDISWERERTLWVARGERWRKGGSSEGAVLRSGEIEAVTSWLMRKPANAAPLPDVIDALLRASREREARDRRRTRRLQTGIGALMAVAALVLVAGATGVLRVTQQQGARSAEMLSRLSERAFETGDFDLAARYAIAGLNGHDSFLLGFEAARLEANLAASVMENKLDALWRCNGDGTGPIAISDDDGWFAAAGAGGVICVWETETGERRFTLQMDNDEEELVRVMFSGDGSRLLASNGLAVDVWDLSDGARFASITPADYSRDAVISGDGRMVAVAADRGPVQLYDASTGVAIRALEGHRSGIVDVEFSPDGARLLSASAPIVTQSAGGDHSVRVWDVTTGRQIVAMAHNADLNGAHFSPDGERVVSSGWDEVRVWNARTGEMLANLPGSTAVFSGDGHVVMSVGEDGVRLRDDRQPHQDIYPDRTFRDSRWGPNGLRLGVAVDGRSVIVRAPGAYDLTLRPQAEIRDVVFSNDGRRVYGATVDGRILAWRVEPPRRPTPTTLPVDFVSYSLPFEGGTRAIAFERDGTIALFNLESGGDPVRMRGGAVGRGWPNFSNNGARITWTAYDGDVVRVWNAHDGAEVAKFELASLRAQNVTTDQAGATLLGVAGEIGRVWDVGTGRVLIERQSTSERLLPGGLSRDGRLVAILSGAVVSIADLRTGREIATVAVDAPPQSVEFSPDGSHLLLRSEGGSRYLRYGRGAREILRTDNRVEHSPDGALLLGQAGGVLTVWDAASGQELFSRADSGAFAWTRDGRYLVIMSAQPAPNLTTVLVQASTGAVLATSLQDFMSRPAFSTDGRIVFFVNGDDVTPWDVSAVVGRRARELVEHACGVILARDERRLFSETELTRTPVLDPLQDRDPCAMPSPWQRLTGTLFPR